jgi:DNA replication protein DnaC
LPFVKTIDEYDCAFHPDLDKTQIASLFDLTFLSRQENVMLLGPPGVGKTHLAVALAVKAAQAGHSIYFTTMADLVTKLKEDETSGRSIKARSHSKAALVVVDEVGYTPIDRRECYLSFGSIRISPLVFARCNRLHLNKNMGLLSALTAINHRGRRTHEQHEVAGEDLATEGVENQWV